MALDLRRRLVNVRELKERISSEAARRGVQLPPVAGAREAPRERVAFVPSPLPPYKLQPDLHPRAEGYSIADFGAVNDEAFVVAAYVSVLGRLPDMVGQRQALAALRRGTPKALILGRLRYSREGRAVGVRIRGLLGRVLFYLVQRIPLVGWVASQALALARPARESDRQNRLESLVAQLSEELARQSAERLQVLSADQARLADQVEELRRTTTAGSADFSAADAAQPEVVLVEATPQDFEGLLAVLDGAAAAPALAFPHEVLTCPALERLCGPGEATPARCAGLFRVLLEQRGFVRCELLDLGDRGLLLVAWR